MSDRTFGVEIEFGTRMYESDVQRTLNTEIPGYEEWWECYPDGTAVEVHTPPLAGDEGFELLKRIFDVLRSKCNGYVTEEDGMHVHFGAGDYADNPAILARAVRSWINLEPVLNRFIVPYRRGGFWACGDFNASSYAPDLPKELRKIKAKKEGRIAYAAPADERHLYPGRRKLNIDHVVAAAQYEKGSYKQDVTYQPTLEVRSHEGTLEFETAEAWIKMLRSFFDYHVSRPSLPKLRRPETLLERLNVDAPAATVLLNRVRQFDRGEYSRNRYDEEMDEPDDYDDGYYWY